MSESIHYSSTVCPHNITMTTIIIESAHESLPFRLLDDFDSRSLRNGVSSSSIASQDCLFLKHDEYHRPILKDTANSRHIVGVTAALLDGLHSTSPELDVHGAGRPSQASPCVDFACPNFLANLIHLILFIRQAALDAIVRYLLDFIEDHVLRWYQIWLHRKGATDDWFAEWPNGQRPLSTTWPWNIKPALLVLWGVCWMFYDNERRAPHENVPPASEQDFWTRQAAAQSQAPAQQPRQYTMR